MDVARSSTHWDRDVMAMLLETNVQLVGRVLRTDDEDAAGTVMRAISATRSLDMIVEDSLRALVGMARAEGHTWAEIGELLHVSRQAAFQRFGGSAPLSSEEEIAVPVGGAAEAALAVLQAFIDGRFDDVRAGFDERMLEACPVEVLADVRERVRTYGGEIQEIGTPAVSARGGYTAVDIPVALDRSDGIGRVVVDADLRTVGFFVQPKDGRA